MSAGRRLLVAALVAAGATLAIVPGASAQSTYVRGIDGVLHEGCRYQPFSYAIDADQARYNWSLEVTAFDPRGVQVGSSWLWKDEGDPSAGTATGSGNGIRICAGATPGTYRLSAHLNFYLAPYDDEALAESSFTMREPGSRTALSVDDTSPSVGQQVRFRIRSRVEQPEGLLSNGHRRVALEKKTPGGWVRVGTARTDGRGVAVVEVSWRNRAQRAVRALTPRTDSHRRSRSATIRIR